MRDRDVRLAIKDLLEQTGSFDEVSLRGLPEDWGSRAGSAAIVFIEPLSSEETDLWDGGPATGSTINSTVIITCAVRESDPQLRDEKCELLIDTVTNAIQGQSLANLTNPDHTRRRQVLWSKPNVPERRVTMRFIYEYIIDGWAGFDTEGDTLP